MIHALKILPEFFKAMAGMDAEEGNGSRYKKF